MRKYDAWRWGGLLFLLAGLSFDQAAGQLLTPAGLPTTSAQQAGFDAKKLAAVDRLLERAVGDGKIAGGAALVARRGAVVHLAMAGMQDAEARVPIRAETIYRIASMTKPVTSVAAMMLVEEGKIRLDDAVGKFIPSFQKQRVLAKGAQAGRPLEQITAAARRPVTIHQLLTHTSGLSYGFWDRPVLGGLYREAGVSDGLAETAGASLANAERLAGVPLMFEPGSDWEYGLNTDVLGCVVEQASGKSLGAFFEERIFAPLGMRDTHFLLPSAQRPRLAALYEPDAAQRVRRTGPGVQVKAATRYSATYPMADDQRYESGGAGLVSTIGDYCRFLQCLLNGGELNGRRILKVETVAQMTRNQIGDYAPSITHHGDKFGYGFGVVTGAAKDKNSAQDEVARPGAFSWGGIFYTYFLVDPQEQLISIWMSQVYPFDHLTLHEEFKQAVYAARLPGGQ